MSSPALTFVRFVWQQIQRASTIKGNFERLANFGALAPALKLLPADALSKVAEATLSGSEGGWRSAGVSVVKGQGFTVFADGVVWIAPLFGLGTSPATSLWVRIGGKAPIRKMSANATSFEAWSDGALEFCLKPPGEWLDDSGAFDPKFPPKGASGDVSVVVALWASGAAKGVDAFERVTGMKGIVPAGVAAPEGWNYLWRLGDGAIYRGGSHDDKPCIHVHTHGDVGILQYPIEAPLDDDVRLEWRWRVDKLPSALPEHITPTHDYLSIAVEYDNGQDLTYYWSADLPADTIFKCPLDWWSERETHWAVRSGTRELGTWVSESRSLKADYAKAIAGALPAKIVRVWLIANSAFQRQTGEAQFADIALVSGGQRRQIV